MNKTQRLNDISKIISNQNFTSQNELLKVVISKGYNITQATLSRDLKTLKASKVPHKNGKYHYVISENTSNQKELNIDNSYILRGFISIEFSYNIAVIKTVPAFASTISYAIDDARIYNIIGTIAGDNTIMVILRENTNIKDFKKNLINKFPELEHFIKL